MTAPEVLSGIAALSPGAYARMRAALATMHAARTLHGEGMVPLVQALEAAGLLQSPETAAEVERLRAVEANARKLVSAWLRASAEHISISNLDAVRDTPLMAGMQDGRANQYSDCANELRDVLDGEDPDGFEFGVSVQVTAESEDALAEREFAAEAGHATEHTDWRAWHDSDASMPLGQYTGREAAMGHVHHVLAREESVPVEEIEKRVRWQADDPHGPEDEPTVWECWLTDADGDDEKPTGYVVSPVEVAAAYDPDGDE